MELRGWLAGLGLAALAVATVAGCPPPPAPPPKQDAGQPCRAHEDCNERTCGLLRACVDGYCEREPSLRVPCRP